MSPICLVWYWVPVHTFTMSIRCNYNGHRGHTSVHDGSVLFYGITFPAISDAIQMLRKVRAGEDYRGVTFSRGAAQGLLRSSDGMVLVTTRPYSGSKLFSSVSKAERIFGQHFF